MRKVLTVSLSMVLVLLVVSMGSQFILADDSYAAYVNDGFGFKMDYPRDWSKQEGFMGTTVIFLSPMEGSNDRFREILSVMVQDLSTQPMTLDQYTELSIQQIGEIITDGQVISSTKVGFAGGDGWELIYAGKQGQYKLKWKCQYIIFGDKAYLLTYAAEEDKFEKYLTGIEQMFRSFTLIR